MHTRSKENKRLEEGWLWWFQPTSYINKAYFSPQNTADGFKSAFTRRNIREPLTSTTTLPRTKTLGHEILNAHGVSPNTDRVKHTRDGAMRRTGEWGDERICSLKSH